MWLLAVPTHRSRQGCCTCRDQVSTTRRRPLLHSFTPSRPTSFVIGIRAAKSASSAKRRCRHRTRSSSSSAIPRVSSRGYRRIEVGAIQRTPANCYNCQNTNGSGSILEWILAVGAIALLLPMLILIATASRLSSARREERFAAMRLIGATPHQISVVSAVEAALASLAGVAVGFALFFLVRPLLYNVPFTGAPFAHGDLSLTLVDIAIALIGVPLAAVVSARLALRRVQISPLGVTRRVSSRPPRIFRLIPLAAGIALLAYFDAAGKPGAVGSQLLELLVGFMLLVTVWCSRDRGSPPRVLDSW